MGKKSKDAYLSDFLADLKTVVGDDKWSAIEENLVKNEKALSKIKDGVLARSEFSSQMDELDSAKKAFSQEVTEARQKIAGWQDWYGSASKAVTDLETKVKAYQETYGDLESGKKPRFLTEEDFMSKLAEETRNRDAAAIKFADDLTDLKISHRERFKERLNTNDVLKIAGDRQLPLDVAYDLYVKDRVEAQNKTEREEELKAAREEGARDFATKHNLPLVSSNPDIVHVLDTQGAPTTAKERVSAALANWGKNR